MEEKTFFSEGDVSVTNARFMARGQTFAMSGVTAVERFREDPSRKPPIIMAIVGGVCLALGSSMTIVGITLLVGATAMWYI